VRFIYLFITKIIVKLQITAMKKKTENILVNVKRHWTLLKAILYFTTFIHDLNSNNGVLAGSVLYTVLIHFPIIAQRSKGAHYFHKVVCLVVISMSVA